MAFRYYVGLIVILAIVAVAPSFGQTTDFTLGLGGVYTSVLESALDGSDIPTTSVDTLTIIDGLLDFTSGAYDGNGSNLSWSGGTLTVTGCIAGVTATVCNGSDNVTLLSADFQSVQIAPTTLLGDPDAVFTNLTGTLNSELAADLGVSTAFETASFTTTIAGTDTPLLVTDTNVSGKLDPVSVPEQWGFADSGLFFGLALGCFAALRRFRILHLVH